MSDFFCPRCYRHFSGEEMTKFIEEMTKQKRLDQLKERFMEESGWGAKKKKTDTTFLAAMFSPLVFYLIVVGLLIKYASANTFLYYFVPLLIGSIAIMVLVAVMGTVIVSKLEKKANRAFSEWRLASGN